MRFRRWIEQPEQRRKYCDTCEEGDDHAHACDLPEFGKPFVGGRGECQKSSCSRHCGQRQPTACVGRGGYKCGQQFLVLKALRAVANTELQAEIDPDPDEEDEKGN